MLYITGFDAENLQPMIQESIQECCLILAPFSTVLRLMQTPSSITTPGPMVTLGPGIMSLGEWITATLKLTYHTVGPNFGSWIYDDISNKTRSL